jgi:hypothetical protein
MGNLPIGKTAKPSPEMVERALKSLKQSAGRGTTDWLANLKALVEESTPLAENPNVSLAETARIAGIDMVHEVDKLFDLFTQYAYEFNRSAAGAGQNIDVDRPVHLTVGGETGRTIFSGRLMMRQWSLVIRGQEEEIEGTMIPSDQVLAYNLDPDSKSYPPYFQLKLGSLDGEPTWLVGSKPLPFSELPTFAKQLFAALVRIAKKGKATRSFRFDWKEIAESDSSSATGISETPEKQTASSPPRPSSYYTEAASSPPRPSSYYPEAASSPPRPSSYYTEADSASPTTAPAPFTAPQAFTAPPDNVSAQLTSQPSRPSMEPSPLASAGSLPAAGPASGMPMQQPGMQRSASVAEGLELALTAMTYELDVLAHGVSQSFENHNLEAAEHNLGRSTKLKALQQRLRSLQQDWMSFTTGG